MLSCEIYHTDGRMYRKDKHSEDENRRTKINIIFLDLY